MNNSIIKSFILIGILTIFSSYSSSDKSKRRINKEIKRVFGDIEVLIIPVEINGLVEYPNKEFYKLKVGENLSGYLAVIKANGCRVGGCKAPVVGSVDEYEQFSFIVIFDNLKQIKKVSVIDYNSEYGYEITSRGWLKQFIKTHDLPYVYGENIDAISGATKSGKSIINEINEVHYSIIKM